MNLHGEEVFFVDTDRYVGKTMVYVPLRSYLALAPEASAAQLKEEQLSPAASEFFARLKRRPLISIQQTIQELSHCTPHLTLALTEDCSLRCQYCYAAAGEDHRKSAMTPQLISKVVEKYFSTQKFHKNEPIEVTFMGGGEPTFRFDLLQHAVAEVNRCASSASVKATFSLATNGFYGTPIRKFLVDNFSNISLSLDGPADIQNLHRPAADGSGTFDRVFETAKYLYAAGAPMAFRATVTSYSVNRVREIVDFFCGNFPKTSLGFEIFIPHGRGAHCTLLQPPSDQEFSRALLDAIAYGRERNYSITNAAASEYHIVRGAFCSAVAVPEWTITVNGTITCCERDGAPDEFTFGYYDEKEDRVVLDDAKISALRSMNVLNYPECQECFCKYNCAGDCPDRRMEKVYKTDCDSIRKIGSYMLSQKLAETIQ